MTQINVQTPRSNMQSKGTHSLILFISRQEKHVAVFKEMRTMANFLIRKTVKVVKHCLLSQHKDHWANVLCLDLQQ